MKASETQLFLLLQGQKHFMIPLFQRRYSWDTDDLETLWNDLIETYEMGPGSTHFLGSLVTKTSGATAEGVSSFIVIDGQQRLTTLTILLAAIRDAIRGDDEREADKIQDLYLSNHYATGTHFYTVMPTQMDRQAYQAVIDGSPEHAEEGLVRDAYTFFQSRIKQSSAGDSECPPVDLRVFLDTVLSGIELVSITLEEDDSEYRIFESLNAKGTPLTQADLLRNYFFMRIPTADHDQAYDFLWMPMQDSLQDKLEDFFRYEFMSHGRFVRHGDVYHSWKIQLDRPPDSELIHELTTLSNHSRLFKKMIDPSSEPEQEIASRLTNLNKWGAQSAYPFILFAYRKYHAKAISPGQFAELLQMIESFLVRRLICGVPTNALNRLFLRLSDQIPEDMGIVDGTRYILSEPSRRWPTDQQFREGILNYPLFTDSRGEQRRHILESLERSYGHKEVVDLSRLTIEHILPQTLSQEWLDDLGITAEDASSLPLHVLGNLTLTGYNPELSNSRFSTKKERLASSHVEMNKEIARNDKWTVDEIFARGERLAAKAISIWPGPSRQ